MRTFSSLLFAAVAAVPLFTLMPASEATAQVRSDRSSDIGNHGYRDQSGYRSRGEGRRLGYQHRSYRGYGYNNGYGRRGKDRGLSNYGYRGYSGYRPISSNYRSYGYAPYGSSVGYGYSASTRDCAPTVRRAARYSYGYTPSSYGYRSYGYAPVAYGYDDDDSYGYGSYGYSSGVSLGFSW